MTIASSGQTAVVTGGTDGIGKAIARGLAERGTEVILIGRNVPKGQAAERELRAATSSSAVHFLQADLALMQEVAHLAAIIQPRWPRLRYLVLCAGVVNGRHQLTTEGSELM